MAQLYQLVSTYSVTLLAPVSPVTPATSVFTDPADYSTISVELTFSAGTTRNCQEILIENDEILEGTENLFANLTTLDPDVILEPDVTEILVFEDPNDGMCSDDMKDTFSCRVKSTPSSQELSRCSYSLKW